MLATKEKISTSQAITLTVFSILGIKVLSLPRDLCDLVKNDGFILIILVGLLVVGAGYLISRVIYIMPNTSFFDMCEKLMSKSVAYILSVILLLYFVYTAGLSLRIFTEVVKMYMLSYTPTEVIIITMILLCTYCARSGIEAIARISQLLFILMIVPNILVFLLGLESAQISNVLPLFTSSPMDLLKGAPSVVFAMSGFEVLLILAFFLNKPRDSFKIQYISISAIVIIYLFFVMMSIAIFGCAENSHMLWPLITVVKVINIPGAFLENLDALIMGSWMISVFMNLSIQLYVVSILLSEMLSSKESTYLVSPLIPIIYFIAMYPGNLSHLYSLLEMNYLRFYQWFILFIMPMILYVCATRYKKVNYQ